MPNRANSWLRLTTLAGLSALALASPLCRALAETAAKPTPAAASPSPQSSPVSDEPAATTATFGDWVMRCQRTGEGDKTVRICEAAQTVQVQGQSAPIAQIGIGRLTPSEPLRVTAVLPPNVSFPGNVHIVTDDKDDPGIDLAWRRCLPGGCIADAGLESETLKHWRSRTAGGRLSYKDGAGRPAAIPFSFRGLAQSLDALAKETR